jgi:hypothetical protein
MLTMSRAAAATSARLAALLTVALVLAQLHPRGRPATVCLLRRVTGIPCPFCGGTTAAVHVGSADLLGALRASPLAVLGAPVVAALPLLRERLLPHLRPGPSHLGLLTLGAVLAASELWQLHRFGWI